MKDSFGLPGSCVDHDTFLSRSQVVQMQVQRMMHFYAAPPTDLLFCCLEVE